MVQFEDIIHHPGPFYGLKIIILTSERLEEAMDILEQSFELENPRLSIIYFCTNEDDVDFLLQCDVENKEELDKAVDRAVLALTADIKFEIQYQFKSAHIPTEAVHETVQRDFTGGGG
jgi:hypothetical protein